MAGGLPDVPLVGGLALWVWILIAFVLVAIGVGGYFGWRLGSVRVIRRYLTGLVGSRERIFAARRTDARSEDRRALVELAYGMRLTRDELDVRRMPSRLHTVASELADAAHLIAEQAGRVTDDLPAPAVFDAVGEIDLVGVSFQYDHASAVLDELCEEYGVEDAAVYGGGLYI
jgi:ABC-type multidrug transport system fused ATPase/permease subunit